MNYTVGKPLLSQKPGQEQKNFLRWQCRIRQTIMRDKSGRPDDGIAPSVKLPEANTLFGSVITVLSKRPDHSHTAELVHIAKQTHDPAQRRENGVRYLSASYFQRAEEFSDILTASFPPGSESGNSISKAGQCVLIFKAYGRHIELQCTVSQLQANHWHYQATWWHNFIFTPSLSPDAAILGFMPNWDHSSSFARDLFS